MAQQTAMFSREDKMKLLENANTFKWLTIKQLLKLIWWEWFNKKKIEAFYNGLNMGKAAIFAYKDADQYYTKTYGNNNKTK